jgi:2-polyprenyl-3-methyl-5-hydroxy-6-metoxy-1,4-benzoquinol methylase
LGGLLIANYWCNICGTEEQTVPDDITDIRTFYDRNVENEDGRLERHPIERDITWRYLNTYLPKTGKVLDIGAGTGPYAIPLAQRGYFVTAVDLSPALIGVCKARILVQLSKTI